MVWIVFFHEGAKSHKELLVLSVTAVWFSQKWLIVPVSVITLETPGRRILPTLLPSQHSFCPTFLLIASLLLPLSLIISWLLLAHRHLNKHSLLFLKNDQFRLQKSCWSVSLECFLMYYSSKFVMIWLQLRPFWMLEEDYCCKSGVRPSHQWSPVTPFFSRLLIAHASISVLLLVS